MDKRTLEKYEREAKEKNRETWYLAWALDTNQEERNKVTTASHFFTVVSTQHTCIMYIVYMCYLVCTTLL